MRLSAGHGWRVMSLPKASTRPFVGRIKPNIIPTVVLLPEPFGPRKPNTSPRSKRMFKLSTAVIRPYRLERSSVHNTSLAFGVFFTCTSGSKSRFRRPVQPNVSNVTPRDLPPEQEDSGVTLKEDWKSRQNFMPLSHASPCVKVVVPAACLDRVTFWRRRQVVGRRDERNLYSIV